jgi:hypothetical protein
MAIVLDCSVLRCPDPEELYWSTGESEEEFAWWGLCRTHFALLRSGVDWATASDMPHSAGQWIVLGSDFRFRQADAVAAATVVIEFTGTGKEMRIEFTTGGHKVDVLLDEQHARDLVTAVVDNMFQREPPAVDLPGVLLPVAPQAVSENS